ncbi:hypothetical protein F5884DRAFT_851584 [Xylogone sp. PMI_703]|nr:hypothetical protein F5884DRAFT_851584 [Xylogone sp. PMI_703]
MAANADKPASITVLPLATTNLLGSAQVLTDSASLIKELIENAIDAKATFIHISISSDSLTRIEVHDNGHGISPTDLGALGKEGYTSKLRSFSELKYIGGMSFGFRGQALASAGELGQVTVITRTDGESTATVVKLKASGGIASQSQTSRPVGTTVSVSNFLSNLPVRKMNALKKAPKTLYRIKSLVQSYALARPQIKFCLNAMNHRQASWSFALGSDKSLKYAILQVVGKAIASQCVERTLVFPISPATKSTTSCSIDGMMHPTVNTDNVPEPSIKSDALYLQAFLPVRDADMSRIGGGQYISIDSRPMACNKGIAKKIVSLFKKYLRELCIHHTSEKVKDTFLRLNIDCPVAAYDLNVEPAKDDVLFEDEGLVLSAIDSIFRNMYGSYSYSSKPISNSPVREKSLVDISLKRQGTKDDRLKWRFNMSKDYTEDVRTGEQDPTNDVLSRGDSLHSQTITNSSSLNPWIIARINCPVPQKISLQQNPCSEECDIADPAPVIPGLATNTSGQYHLSTSATKQYHYINTNPESTSKKSPVYSIARSYPIGNGKNVQTSANSREALVIDSNKRPSARNGGQIYTPDFQNALVGSGSLAEEGFLSPPHTQLKSPKTPITIVKKNTIRPTARSNVATTTNEKAHFGLPAGCRISTLENCKAASSQAQKSNTDLDWAMDFEQRKEHATRHRRQQLLTNRELFSEAKSVHLSQTPITKIATLHISPHSENHIVSSNAAISATKKYNSELSMPEGDLSAHNIIRQRSITDGPLVGLRLPPQNVPNSNRTHNLCRRIRTNRINMRQVMETFTVNDSYMQGQTYAIGTDLGKLDNKALRSRLRILVDDWTRSRESVCSERN